MSLAGKHDRRSAVRGAFRRLIGFFALVFPLLIVATYYLAGWQTAVLLFPVPLVLAKVRSRLDAQARQRREPLGLARGLLGGLLLVGLLALPVVAVIAGDAGPMRAWAYLTAGPLALFFARDDKSIRMTGNMMSVPERWLRAIHFGIWGVVALVFIGASEVIWLSTSMGAWIWYHAFAVPIFFLLMALVQVAATALLGSPSRYAAEKVSPPQRLSEDRTIALATVTHRQKAASRGYGAVTLSQAQMIVSEVGNEPIASAGTDPTQMPLPHFVLLFDDAALVTIFRDGNETFGCRWRFMRSPKPTEFLGAIEYHSVESVPLDLLPQLVAVAWTDDWDDIMALLRPYAPTDILPA